VFSDGLDGNLIHDHSTATLQFTRRPLNMTQVVAECALGICNANHATTAAVLRAGRRLLVLPITLEQTLLAIQLKRKGLAAAVSADDTQGLEFWLRAAFENTIIGAAVASFATKYAPYDGAKATLEIANCIERLM
jgi:UDP:flavonoid glycosyltransferase YjiC (YdhE family)